MMKLVKTQPVPSPRAKPRKELCCVSQRNSEQRETMWDGDVGKDGRTGSGSLAEAVILRGDLKGNWEGCGAFSGSSNLWNCSAKKTLEAPWTARRSNHSILKAINLEYLLEGLKC